MKQVAVYEAKTRLSELLAEVEKGAQVTITRHGLPVARLVGVATPKAGRRGASSQSEQVSATISELKRWRSGVVLEGSLQEIIGEGRD